LNWESVTAVTAPVIFPARCSPYPVTTTFDSVTGGGQREISHDL
jgi:hypothetical protein